MRFRGEWVKEGKKNMLTGFYSGKIKWLRVKRRLRVFNAPLIISLSTIGEKIVENSNRVTSENTRIRTPPLSPPFKVGLFVIFCR